MTSFINACRIVAALLVLSPISVWPTIAQADEGHATSAHGGLVTATRPLRREVAIVRDYVSQISAARHIEVRAMERGYLETVEVAEGQSVRKGQLMFRIRPVLYEAELRRAKAEADAARVEYDNTRQLAEGNVVSSAQVALARAHYERAGAEVSLAEAHLSFTEIRAPFDGIIDRLHLREGSLVDEGDLLTMLSDNSAMWVYFNVPEVEYLEFAEGADTLGEQQVKLLMANGKAFAEPGRIAAIEAEFNNRTGTIAFRADFPNPTGLLRHGQTGKILLSKSLSNALLLPQKATFEILDQTYVYVVDADNTVQQRRITIAEELEDVFVIEKGLADTDIIILEGLRSVRDGAVIEYELESPEVAFNQLKLHAE